MGRRIKWEGGEGRDGMEEMRGCDCGGRERRKNLGCRRTGEEKKS